MTAKYEKNNRSLDFHEDISANTISSFVRPQTCDFFKGFLVTSLIHALEKVSLHRAIICNIRPELPP